jgi:DNA-directed RNA polymerase subunit RPC12/RpoP
MTERICPGQDLRYWKPEDIFESLCPECGKSIEFFKNDPMRRCPNCGHCTLNPKKDMACAEWCPYAKECLASTGVIDEFKALKEAQAAKKAGLVEEIKPV